MRHSPIRNYVVPGLTSWLIMDQGKAGKVRMFENTREQHHFITPHSHRFNFSACVVQGVVENVLWTAGAPNADRYCLSSTVYVGAPGQYVKKVISYSDYQPTPVRYAEGEWYSMKHSDIHSIKFSKGAIVLFFEGPEITSKSFVLEPVVDGQHIQTMMTEPWMFIKGTNDKTI